MVVKLYEKNTDDRLVHKVVKQLLSNELMIYPTDTIYAIGCSLNNLKGKDKLCRILGKPDKWSEFSLICYDLSQISNYTKPIPNSIFKLMKKNLPGPFTFILNANNNVPKIFKHKKTTIGIRIPDNNIILKITEVLGSPIVGSSIHDEDEVIEYSTDPELIFERFEKCVDIFVDGGYGNNIASTVVDCTSGEPVVIREGAGELIY